MLFRSQGFDIVDGDKAQRQSFLGCVASQKLSIESFEAAVGPGKVDRGAGMDEHDELLRVLGRRQDRARTDDRRRQEHGDRRHHRGGDAGGSEDNAARHTQFRSNVDIVGGGATAMRGL